MMKDPFSFPFPSSKKVRIVILKLESGEIVARTVEEMERMYKEGVKFEVLKEEE